MVPEQLRVGHRPSTLTGSRQQQGVTQRDGTAEVRVFEQLQGCGEGRGRVVKGCPGLSSVAGGTGGDSLAQPPGPARRQ